MRLDQQTEKIETNIEEGSARTFQMVANGASFRVLSDALYSDKPGAIIRELTCNGWDAHVAAGHTDKQVEIHLPDALMPEFWVRDFGTGLSDEDVLGLYTTYFQSTKSQSNLFTGALGLGSKSPFCYTDNFVVESYLEGTLRRYQVYLSEDIPSILPIGEETTDLPNGLRISFSVPEKDHHLFRVAAEKQLFLFGDKTTYSSNFASMAHFRGNGVFLDNEHFTLSKEMITSSYSRSVVNTELFAAMGNVLYRIDPAMVLDGNAHILGIKAILKFDMGAIDFAASRENLSYKPRTVAAIKAKLALIFQAVSDHFDVMRAALENEPIVNQIFTSLRLRKENRNSSNNIHHLYQSIKNEFFWDLILKRVSNYLTNECRLSVVNYNQKWSRRENKWFVDTLGIEGFFERLQAEDFRCVKGTSRPTAENFTKVMRKSNLPASGGVFCFASEDNWEKIEKYLNLEFGYAELDFDIPKDVRPVYDGEKFQNRKIYDHWIKGSKDSTRMFKENFDAIFFNNEDNVDKEWMRVFSALLDSPKTPFIYYRGPIRSALECSFVNYTYGHYGHQTIEPHMQVIKDRLAANVKKMRLYDALYCQRFLHKEIRIIQDALPFSEFVQEIANIEIFPLIEDADDMQRYLNNAGLLPSCPSYECSVPEFLDRYPMLRLIRADSRHGRYGSNINSATEKEDAKQLIDYIRLCEGEGYEVHHYDIISDSKRRKRKSLALQDRARRKESLKVDREEGHEGIECDSEEALNDLHRESVQEEEHRDQEREVLLQGQGDSQRSDNDDDSVVSFEEADGSLHGILRERNEKSLRKFSQRTVRLLGVLKAPDYKSWNFPRVS